MNHAEAKKALALYRPGIDDKDPEIREALQVANADPELRQWLAEHKRFQAAVRGKFQEIPVPASVRERILAKKKIVRPTFPSRQTLWLASAALVLFFAVIAVLFKPNGSNRFADYESRMVRGALREYRMDLVTSDLAQIRLAMASRGAPSQFSLPKGLSKLSVVGGGALKWRSNPVTMVCFDRGDKQMLFLFVLSRSAVKDSPAPKPEITRISRLQSASWTEGEQIYVLAGPEEAGFVQKYL
ncbi:MAG: hypothetical protein JWM68_4506 [Verrucomicrobiales bacterium]|nr:hypothetical protein [Verrucomicrobiales bacterium]